MNPITELIATAPRSYLSNWRLTSRGTIHACRSLNRSMPLSLMGVSILLALFTLAAHANETGPRISAPETAVDLGTVAVGEPVIHTFVYQNIGSAPLTFDVIDKNCSCGTTSHTQGEIAPGDSGSLTVEYIRKDDVAETQDIYLYVVARTNEPQDIRFELRASRRLAVFVTPRQIQIAEDKENAKNSAALVVECLREQGEFVDISRISVNSPWISVVETDVVPRNDVVRHEYSVQAAMPRSSGANTAVISIETTSKIVPYIEVPVTAKIDSPLIVEPPILTIPGGGSGDSLAAKAAIRLRRPTAHEVTAAKADSDLIEAELQKGAKDSEWILHVRAAARTITQKIKSVVRLIGPSGEELGAVPVLIYPPAMN